MYLVRQTSMRNNSTRAGVVYRWPAFEIPQIQTPLPPMQFLLTDPLTIGIVTWIGFLATFLALGIAIQQIRRVAGATKAAAIAITALTDAVHSRERLLDLSAALRQLDSARTHIGQRDYAKAIIFLEFARSECVQAQELFDVGIGKGEIRNLVIRLTKLIEGLTYDEAKNEQEITAVQRGLEAREIANGLGAALARLRYRFQENGMQP